MGAVKTTRSKLFAVAAALVLLGVVLFALQPGEPEGECVTDGGPSSGFVDSDSGCPISIESYEEIADYRSSAKPFRIAGLVFVLAGVGVAITGAVKKPRSEDTPTDA